MNKLKQILEFIRALLGFLLNLKKKKTDEKNEKAASPDTGQVAGRCAGRYAFGQHWHCIWPPSG